MVYTLNLYVARKGLSEDSYVHSMELYYSNTISTAPNLQISANFSVLKRKDCVHLYDHCCPEICRPNRGPLIV